MQSTWLTQTKFVPPRLRDDVVLRGRLADALRTAVNSRLLTLLSTPAGYGKTTLLITIQLVKSLPQLETAKRVIKKIEHPFGMLFLIMPFRFTYPT